MTEHLAPAAELMDESRRFNRWALKLLHGKRILAAICILSFIRNMIIPMPLEMIMLPMMLANRKKILAISLWATIGCVGGGTAFYLVGRFLFDAYGTWFLHVSGLGPWYPRVVDYFDHYGFWSVVVMGIAPVPYQVVTLASGAAGFSLPLFVLASFIGRGTRYFGLGILALIFGDRMIDLWKRYLARFSLVCCGLLVVAYVAYKVFF